MQRDLALSDAAFGLGAGLFFIGYCLFEVPSNLILEWIGARLWIARIMVGWGLVSMAMMFVTNTAILQTVPRTINTGMGAAFILSALALLGGDSLTDFALALLIGIVVGTYSSMFTAAPLAVELHARSTAPPGTIHRTGPQSAETP